MSSLGAPKPPPKATSPKSSPKASPSPFKSTPPDPTPVPECQGEGAIQVDESSSGLPELVTATGAMSLRPSILNYKWENGRRYHAYEDGSYWGPNDDKQQQAEDIFHEMIRLIFDGRLHDIPELKDPHAVLDMGCGTGAWSIDFADENPGAKVVGVDLSPIQSQWVPPNCEFEVDDINKNWMWPVDHFDFIHVRAMTGCVDDWVDFYKKAYQHLRPGGWVQQIELSAFAKSDDGTITAESPYHAWAEVFQKISEAMGKSFFACENACQSLQDAGGFVNIHERRIKLPIGTWPKDMRLKHWGALNQQYLLQGLEGFSIRGLTSMLEWTYEDTQLFLVQMRKELTDLNIHSYIDMCIVYGQKPT